MENLNRSLPIINIEQKLPEKVIMFGEGAFLRAFACPAFEELNRIGLFGGSITIIQPIPEGKIELLKKQEGLFNVVERGVENGKKTVKTKLITCVHDYINPYNDYKNYIKRARNPELRFIISNTTEAGIVFNGGESLKDAPQASFPGKATAFLYERFLFFKGDKSKGLIFLPCELVDYNGERLKQCIKSCAIEWNLDNTFLNWIEDSCIFTNTLVDRIVAGYPSVEAYNMWDELGYCDELLDTCELFYFWAIEGPPELKHELPFDKTGLNIIFSDDITPYRIRKVRMLNGAHTCLAPAALLCGFKTVGDAINDSQMRRFIEKALYKEIIPTLDINKNVLEGYAKSMLERFSNPFIEHKLLGIILNCLSKFKVRVLPSILEYQRRFGEVPPILACSFAAMIAFYKNGGRFEINDDEKNIAFLRDNAVDIIFKNTSVWEMDLQANIRLCRTVEDIFNRIKARGIKKEIMRLINDNK